MTIRTVTYIGTVALLSQMFLLQGCGSNNPSTIAGAGGTAGTTPTGGTIGTGGATVAPVTGGTVGTGGATVAPATGGTVGAGGATVAPATGGTIDAGETTGTSDGGSSAFQPLCKGLVTAGGAEPAKGVVCTATDPQLCYKTCGPRSSGFKSETCGTGSYTEESACHFPTGVDYSCYKVPDPWVLDPTCPTTTPQASQPCTVAPCVLCNDANGGYSDSSGNAKTGYCVCPTTSSGSPGTWSCASKTAWPCPGSQGC